jgi:hypothetical protein
MADDTLSARLRAWESPLGFPPLAPRPDARPAGVSIPKTKRDCEAAPAS